MKKLFLAIMWGFVASAMAFWLNELLQAMEIQNRIVLLVVASSMEEVAKFLAIRNCKENSLAVPLIFMSAEAVIIASPIITSSTLSLSILYSLIGLITLKHTLFYTPIYIFKYRAWTLFLAMALHIGWNWYVDTPEGSDALLLCGVCLAVIILPTVALFQFRKRNP